MIQSEGARAGAAPQSNTNILVVEDDAPGATAIAARLRVDGFDVRTVATAEQGLRELRDGAYALVLLDLHLPGMSGHEACRAIRQQYGDRVPVILLSGHGTLDDRLTAFALGADDFVAKPVDCRELTMRARAVLRRCRLPEPAASEEYHGPAGLVVSLASRTVLVRGCEVHVTPTEFHLLRELLARRGEALAADALSSLVWGYETFGERNYLEAQISRLRAKLGAAGASHVIETVRGYGYIIR